MAVNAQNATRNTADALILEGEDLESYIDEAAHKIMNYQPIDGMYGAVRVGNYVVKPHGDRIYSLYAAFSGMVILVKADNPHQAVSKVKGIFEHDRHEF